MFKLSFPLCRISGKSTQSNWYRAIPMFLWCAFMFRGRTKICLTWSLNVTRHLPPRFFLNHFIVKCDWNSIDHRPSMNWRTNRRILLSNSFSILSPPIRSTSTLPCSISSPNWSVTISFSYRHFSSPCCASRFRCKSMIRFFEPTRRC